jgi:hypothetical protein
MAICLCDISAISHTTSGFVGVGVADVIETKSILSGDGYVSFIEFGNSKHIIVRAQ